MDKVLSTIALLVAVLALLFGGYFNTRWHNTVNEPVVIPSISRVSQIVEVDEGFPVDVPEDLREKSTRARYFPTLAATMPLHELRETLEYTGRLEFESAATKAKAILPQLEDPETTDEHAKDLWDRLTELEKAVLLAVRTARLTIVYLRAESKDVDDERIAKTVDRFLSQQDGSSSSEEDWSFAEEEAALREVLFDATRAELHPTREFLAKLISDDISELDAMALEMRNLSEELRRLIATNNEAGRQHFWEVSVKLYNQGGTPAAMHPIATMAVKRVAKGNHTLFMRSRESGNIVIAPGEGIDVTFRSTSKNDNKMVRDLAKDFETGGTDFRMAFEYLDGTRVESGVDNFSKSIGEAVRRNLIAHAETMEFD